MDIQNWEKRFDEYFYDADHSLTPNQVAHIKKNLVAPLLTSQLSLLAKEVEGLYEEKGKAQKVAEALGKQPVSHGPIAQARIDGYRIALVNVLSLINKYRKE